MLSKKATDLIEGYAKEYGIPAEDMKLIISEYYKEIKSKASTLEHWRILVEGLGWMTTSYKKIKMAHINILRDKVDSGTQTAEDKEKQKKLSGIITMMTKEWRAQTKVNIKRRQSKKSKQ